MSTSVEVYLQESQRLGEKLLLFAQNLTATYERVKKLRQNIDTYRVRAYATLEQDANDAQAQELLNTLNAREREVTTAVLHSLDEGTRDLRAFELLIQSQLTVAQHPGLAVDLEALKALMNAFMQAAAANAQFLLEEEGFVVMIKRTQYGSLTIDGPSKEQYKKVLGAWKRQNSILASFESLEERAQNALIVAEQSRAQYEIAVKEWVYAQLPTPKAADWFKTFVRGGNDSFLPLLGGTGAAFAGMAQLPHGQYPSVVFAYLLAGYFTGLLGKFVPTVHRAREALKHERQELETFSFGYAKTFLLLSMNEDRHRLGR